MCPNARGADGCFSAVHRSWHSSAARPWPDGNEGRKAVDASLSGAVDGRVGRRLRERAGRGGGDDEELSKSSLTASAAAVVVVVGADVPAGIGCDDGVGELPFCHFGAVSFPFIARTRDVIHL